jgi:pilus assembly protein FimV
VTSLTKSPFMLFSPAFQQAVYVMLHVRVPRTLWMTRLGMSRTRIPVYLTLGCVWIAARHAIAAGWGVPDVHAVMGQTLRIQIPVEAMDSDRMGPECLKAQINAGTEDGPRMHGIKAWLVPSPHGAQGKWTAEILSSTPVAEPVLHVSVSMGCSNALARQFVVLADPPEESEPPLAEALVPSQVASERLPSAAKQAKATPATRKTPRKQHLGAASERTKEPLTTSHETAANADRRESKRSSLPDSSTEASKRHSDVAGPRLQLEPAEHWTVDQPPAQARVAAPSASQAVVPAASAHLPTSGARSPESDPGKPSGDATLQMLTHTNDALREANELLMRKLEQNDQRLNWLLLAVGLATGGLGAAGFLLWRRQQHLASMLKPWWDGAAVEPSGASARNGAGQGTASDPIIVARLPESSGERPRRHTTAANVATGGLDERLHSALVTQQPASLDDVLKSAPDAREARPVHEVWYRMSMEDSAACDSPRDRAVAAGTTPASVQASKPEFQEAREGEEGDDLLTGAWDATLAWPPKVLSSQEGHQPEVWQGLSRDDGSDAFAFTTLSAEALVDLDRQVEFFSTIGQDEAATQALQAALDAGPRTSPLVYLKLMEIYRRHGNQTGFKETRVQWQHRFGTTAPSWDEAWGWGSTADATRGLDAHPELVAELAMIWANPLDAMTRIERWLFPDVVDAHATRTNWQSSLTEATAGQGVTRVLEPACYPELLTLYAVARDLWQSSAGDVRDDGPVDLLLPLGAETEVAGSMSAASLSNNMPKDGGLTWESFDVTDASDANVTPSLTSEERPRTS